jgi:hypothetical protein
MSVICLLTASLSLNFATTRQWSVSQSAGLNGRTSIKLQCRLLSIKIWSIFLRVFPSDLVFGSRRVLDTEIDRPTDRRS